MIIAFQRNKFVFVLSYLKVSHNKIINWEKEYIKKGKNEV